MSAGARPDYVPGLGLQSLLPVYDTVQRFLGVPRMHRLLVAHAGLGSDERLLEVGCGTGNLALLVHRLRPGLSVVGLDPDPRALARARAKAVPGAPVRFQQGYGQQLPYPDGSFDHVVSAFVLHHLDSDGRARLLREALRVLRPAGRLHLMDVGGRVAPEDGVVARWQLRQPRLAGSLGDAVPTAIRAAGFVDLTQLRRVGRLLGPVSLYQARRAGTAAGDPGRHRTPAR